MRGRSDNDCSTSAHAHCHRDTSGRGDSVADDDRLADPNRGNKADNAGDCTCSHPDNVADDDANDAYLRDNRNIARSAPEPARRVWLQVQ